MRQGEGDGTDETWIVKYREAVKNAPAEKSRFQKIKQAGNAVSKIAASCLNTISSTFSAKGKRKAMTKSSPAQAAQNVAPAGKKSGGGAVRNSPGNSGKRKIC
jgi:hypothetical protein